MRTKNINKKQKSENKKGKVTARNKGKEQGG
jgi:hypothetical protein